MSGVLCQVVNDLWLFYGDHCLSWQSCGTSAIGDRLSHRYPSPTKSGECRSRSKRKQLELGKMDREADSCRVGLGIPDSRPGTSVEARGVLFVSLA